MFDPAKVLRDLRNASPAVRLAAVKIVQKEAFKVSSKRTLEWLGKRQSTTPLITLLAESDPKIAQYAVMAIAEITRRYFKDDRAYPKVVPLLQSTDARTRGWAAAAAIQLRGQKSLDNVVPLCRDRVKNVRHGVFCNLCFLAMRRSQVSPANRRRLQEVALNALGDRDAEVRAVASNILREIGNASAVSNLRHALGKEANAYTKDSMEAAIASVSNRS